MSPGMAILGSRAFRLLALAGCSGLSLLALELCGCATSMPAAHESPPAAQPAVPPSAATALAAARPSELALRKHLASVARGEPNYDDLTPELAAMVRAQPGAREAAAHLGPVESVLFKGVGARGADIYEVTTTQGLSEWRIMLAPDGKITFLLFHVLEKPPAEPLRPDEFASAVRERVDQAAREDQFSGAVLIAQSGKPLCQFAVGLADRERSIANTLETKFRIGSMNKMFTAVAILQLVQAGRVALTDPLGKYLPEYPNQELARQVTLHHLLTHTGGTGDIFGPQYAEHRKELRTLDDYVRLFGARPAEFPPGSDWRYSNYGFVLLGVVIERVSGQSYYDYVSEHVYAPVGMTSTGSFPEDQVVPLRSVGYMAFRPEGSPKPKPGQAWWPNDDSLPYRGTSAGGGYSTVGDLLAFATALQKHVLLDAEHTRLLTTGKVAVPGQDRYAYGFEDQTVGGVHCIGHNGGAPGMNGSLMICDPPSAASPYVIVALANQDPPAAQRIADFVRARLPNLERATHASAE
jgi:D-alanyl-D-alanine carboxypeptidase